MPALWNLFIDYEWLGPSKWCDTVFDFYTEMDLNDTGVQLQYLIGHLSHGLNVHKTYYLMWSDVVEGSRSGVLVLKEMGKLEAFKERKVYDITIEGWYYIY